MVGQLVRTLGEARQAYDLHDQIKLTMDVNPIDHAMLRPYHRFLVLRHLGRPNEICTADTNHYAHTVLGCFTLFFTEVSYM
jgi:hypothetical protein